MAQALRQRMAEFTSGVCLNSNVPELGGSAREWEVVNTPGGRRVGLLGLLQP